MATYRVPQDVEADDKLIGPFSFRQFVYLIIVVMAGALAWGLAQIFVGLAVIPLPVILLFGALALPLRKDQPMEIYLAAIVSFYLKPRQRLWDPEGVESLIEISAPKVVEVSRIKDLSQDEAAQRLSYLANIVDSGGWAIRGQVGGPGAGSAMNSDVFLEAQGVTDVLDTTNGVAQNFDQMMAQSTERMKEEARERMMQATAAAAATASTPVAPVSDPASQIPADLQFNPYPAINQTVIQPLNDPAHSTNSPVTAPLSIAPAPQAPAPLPYAPPQDTTTQTTQPTPVASTSPTAPVSTDETPITTSETTVPAGIIELANNPDLSIATIAHEADRIKKKADESDEVVISLR